MKKARSQESRKLTIITLAPFECLYRSMGQVSTEIGQVAWACRLWIVSRPSLIERDQQAKPGICMGGSLRN
ncbi:MAG: hypothetical protein JJT88_03990 [Gammaproteobacteria bacterium]|nr:hypothetical protein [Gammaproteobacteria bacterium]